MRIPAAGAPRAVSRTCVVSLPMSHSLATVPEMRPKGSLVATKISFAFARSKRLEVHRDAVAVGKA